MIPLHDDFEVRARRVIGDQRILESLLALRKQQQAELAAMKAEATSTETINDRNQRMLEGAARLY